ncbi:DUF397 domain-containing protein [Rhizocola hellebori]|uniref:DUF397 domain-containing protein n=1 Tax=Rhizocola hellebori TaxID=1392758 RepID=UPI001943903D|nr:DUF397 domain-containing protein [Rhizocola hellebori]
MRAKACDRGAVDESTRSSWRRGSKCESHGCVEVSIRPDAVSIRDSKITNGPELAYSHTAWAAFIGAVKIGEFD